MKYYAVKKGKPGVKPAIYTTWDECKSQVQGVSGAVYKSFENEEDAKNFIKEEKTDNSLVKKDVLYAFVDGSYNKNENISGYGLALVFNDEVIYKSNKTLTKKEYVQYRNVYGEVKGTEDAVKLAVEMGYSSVNVVYDYTGIENWAMGNWKTNNDLTKEYAKEMQNLKRKIDINFIKVKAHAKESDGGHKYNDLVDKLAKKSVGLD